MNKTILISFDAQTFHLKYTVEKLNEYEIKWWKNCLKCWLSYSDLFFDRSFARAYKSYSVVPVCVQKQKINHLVWKRKFVLSTVDIWRFVAATILNRAVEQSVLTEIVEVRISSLVKRLSAEIEEQPGKAAVKLRRFVIRLDEETNKLLAAEFVRRFPGEENSLFVRRMEVLSAWHFLNLNHQSDKNRPDSSGLCHAARSCELPHEYSTTSCRASFLDESSVGTDPSALSKRRDSCFAIPPHKVSRSIFCPSRT